LNGINEQLNIIEMKKTKQLGIWMDHSIAFLLEVTNDTIVEKSVTLGLTLPEKEYDLNKNETLIHNKEQQQQSIYYKKLSDIIKNYQDVVLFGPTDAKNELLNLLKVDHLFENIKIEVKHSDKMTSKQMHDFVKEYFK
jgi:hypothetical protein